MDLSQEGVAQVRDALIAATAVLEKRLSEAGVARAHEWMFAVREVLYDFRRLDLLLVELLTATDVSGQAPRVLRDWVQMVLYEVIPHVQGHLAELEQELGDPLDEDVEEGG